MLADYWYAILEAASVRRKPRGVKRLDRRLVVWRDGAGKIVCMEDRCPHRAAKLSAGRVIDGTLECRFHGHRYDGDGACVAIPSLGAGAGAACKAFRATTVPAVERHGLIWIWHGEARASYPEVPWFAEISAATGCTAATSLDVDVDYTKIVGSYFDVHHVPFAHRPYFSLFGPTVTCRVEATADGFIFHATLSPERGPWRGLRSRQVTNQVNMPNLILSRLSPRLVVVFVATPIEAGKCWTMARVYQRYLPLPVVGRAFAWLILQSDVRFFQKQDLAVLRDAGDVALSLDDVRALPADAGTVAYLKLRSRLLKRERAP